MVEGCSLLGNKTDGIGIEIKSPRSNPAAGLRSISISRHLLYLSQFTMIACICREVFVRDYSHSPDGKASMKFPKLQLRSKDHADRDPS